MQAGVEYLEEKPQNSQKWPLVENSRQSKMAPDHLDRNNHSPQEAVVRNDSMWPPVCNLDQENKSNDSKNGKDDFCWSSNISGSDKEGAPLALHQKKVSSSSSSSSSEEEHPSAHETDSTSDISEDEEDILNWIRKKDKPSRTPLYDGRLKWGTFEREDKRTAYNNGWTMSTKWKNALPHLRGEALEFYRSLPKKIRKDYHRLQKALEEQFGRRNQRMTAKKEPQNGTKVQDNHPEQGHGDPVHPFSSRILSTPINPGSEN